MTAPANPPILAQENTSSTIQFSVYLSVPEVTPGEKVDLIIEATNPSTTAIQYYVFQLYLTEGIALAENPSAHDLYEPMLNQTLNLMPGMTKSITVPLYIFENATSLEGVALIHGEEMVARLEMPITGATESPLTPEDDYNMPAAPEVFCPTPPPLSSIGGSVLNALNNYYFGGDYTAGAYFSSLTWCNQFQNDWILDVENVTTLTTPTNTEEFYEKVGNLIRDTEYTFSLSTLGFNTHDESGAYNLVRAYLAPAILDLHNSTPPGGTYPLLRFVYSDGDLFVDFDEPSEVYADLIADLVAQVPNTEDWRVSIAVASIGEAPAAPWNHSKIAVRDYQYAIVGGMNWELNYVAPVDIDADGNHDPIAPDGRIVHRLYDLSLNVEGGDARAANIFFDKLWKRSIDLLFPYLGNDCVVSWDVPIGRFHDCPLSTVPDYAPNGNEIPDYSIDEAHQVFSLGRGHTEWGDNSEIDFSADEAVLAAFGAAQENIYITFGAGS